MPYASLRLGTYASLNANKAANFLIVDLAISSTRFKVWCIRNSSFVNSFIEFYKIVLSGFHFCVHKSLMNNKRIHIVESARVDNPLKFSCYCNLNFPNLSTDTSSFGNHLCMIGYLRVRLQYNIFFLYSKLCFVDFVHSQKNLKYLYKFLESV